MIILSYNAAHLHVRCMECPCVTTVHVPQVFSSCPCLPEWQPPIMPHRNCDCPVMIQIVWRKHNTNRGSHQYLSFGRGKHTTPISKATVYLQCTILLTLKIPNSVFSSAQLQPTMCATLVRTTVTPTPLKLSSSSPP